MRMVRGVPPLRLGVNGVGFLDVLLVSDDICYGCGSGRCGELSLSIFSA